eukprot:c14854_g1_i1.p1 GENE.c14854_g1_i1~~c14854_g1_i1.p1  ORF type:complete len:277 (+),score=55.41 c14854_g1_i1:44-874(+)
MSSRVWVCSVCTLENQIGAKQCEACEAPAPVAPKAIVPPKKESPDTSADYALALELDRLQREAERQLASKTRGNVPLPTTVTAPQEAVHAPTTHHPFEERPIDGSDSSLADNMYNSLKVHFHQQQEGNPIPNDSPTLFGLHSHIVTNFPDLAGEDGEIVRVDPELSATCGEPATKITAEDTPNPAPGDDWEDVAEEVSAPARPHKSSSQVSAELGGDVTELLENTRRENIDLRRQIQLLHNFSKLQVKRNEELAAELAQAKMELQRLAQRPNWQAS